MKTKTKTLVLTLKEPPQNPTDPYKGWTNSATWCFSLYFFQERENYEKFHALARKHGYDSFSLFQELFRNAYKQRKMERLDSWVEGPIYVTEIVREELEYAR